MITLTYNTYLHSEAWSRKKQEAFAIFGRKCARCQITNSELHVHHATYDRLFKENVKTDLYILCSRCHDLYHELLKGVTTIQKTRDFINGNYASLQEINSPISKSQLKLKKNNLSKKNLYDRKINKKKKEIKQASKKLRSKGITMKPVVAENYITDARYSKIQDIYKTEKIYNLKRMLERKHITQEYYDSKMKDLGQ